jgi:EAL and modified HD-GYP domain-containing signal transduction protein
MSSVYIARQPIFDRHVRLAGYELLFRTGDEQGKAVIADADDATSNVVMNTLTEFTLERTVGPHPAWINVTRKFLLDGLADALPAKRCTLELLEGQEVDDELIEVLKRLKGRGFKVALDDFTYDASREALIPIADVVKIDVLALGVKGAAEELRNLRGRGITAVAEKVETQEEFHLCKDEGFELYQGYFFCKPEVMRTKAIGTNKLSLLQLLAALQDPEIELKRLEELIGHDVALSYRLLRYINSAFFGLRTRVDGIGRAIALLGLSNVKRWATMTVFAGIEGKPRELLITAMVRGRMCELLGPELGERSHDQLFTLGLFSVVDALVDAPMGEVLASIPFPDDMVAALTAHAGAKGKLLRSVVHWERGEAKEAAGLGISPGKLAEAHGDAVAWADNATAELLDGLDADALAA